MKDYDVKIHMDVEGAIDIDVTKESDKEVCLSAGVSSIQHAQDFWEAVGGFMEVIKLRSELP